MKRSICAKNLLEVKWKDFSISNVILSRRKNLNNIIMRGHYAECTSTSSNKRCCGICEAKHFVQFFLGVRPEALGEDVVQHGAKEGITGAGSLDSIHLEACLLGSYFAAVSTAAVLAQGQEDEGRI